MPDLELWMRVGQPLEPVLANQERILDAWQSGGVRGLVIGRLSFLADYPEGVADLEVRPVPNWGGAGAAGAAGATVPAFSPNPTVYRKWDVPAPDEPAQPFPIKRERLARLIEKAKGRGWPVWIFEPGAGAGAPLDDGSSLDASARRRLLLTDERHRRAYLARLEDTVTAFPEVDGVILDGPEWGYEIADGHRSNLFDDLGPEVEPAARALGFDYARLVAAKDRLYQRLHKLSREAATLAAPGGAFNGLQLLGNDPGIVSWFAFRQRAMTGFYRQVHQLAEALTRARNRQVKLAICPRTPSLAALCGYDFPATANLFDLILPKLYLWNRGVDGLYGTVSRYATTLASWNPGLWEPEAFAAVRALLGVALPSTEPGATAGQTMVGLLELERGFPDAFFTGWLTDEVKRCVAAADGYTWRVLPWIDSGRHPHGGDPVTAHDLRRLLVAAKEGGVRNVLYHNHGHLSAAEWSVLSDYCGYGWRAGEGTHGQYIPPDDGRTQPGFLPAPEPPAEAAG